MALGLAKRLKLGGGSVFRATAGFGRHGVMHHEAFFELADDLPQKIEFLLSEPNAQTCWSLYATLALTSFTHGRR
jgi:PII-like signaling protein